MWAIYTISDEPGSITVTPFDGSVGTLSEEGPFDTKQEALDFAQSELGVPWVVVKLPTKRRR
jgi:hypothetical protein